MTHREIAYGFVPQKVIEDLKDIGNWKVRACAIDALHKALVVVDSKRKLLTSLPEFFEFLMTLVVDPNFKISLSSMQITADLILKVGGHTSSHLRIIVPKLIEKLGDNKIMVRQAGIQVLRNAMSVTSPGLILDQLVEGLKHSSWRVREEIISMYIMVMLTAGKDQINFVDMAAVLVEGCVDPKDRVRAVALEGLVLLESQLGGPDCRELMSLAGASQETKRNLQKRSRLGKPPFINKEGFVEYEALSSGKEAMAESPTRHRNVQPQGKIPWEIPAPRGHSRSGSSPSYAGKDRGYPYSSLPQASSDHRSRQDPANPAGCTRSKASKDQGYVGEQSASSGVAQSTQEGLGLVERLNRMLQYEDSLDAHAKYASTSSFNGKVNQWMAGPSSSRNPSQSDDKEEQIRRMGHAMKLRESRSGQHSSSIEEIHNDRDDSCSGRLETWSPSKEERLENLKRRQQEARRVHSASAVLQRPNHDFLTSSNNKQHSPSPPRQNSLGSPSQNVLAGPRWTSISSQNEGSERSSSEGHSTSGREVSGVQSYVYPSSNTKYRSPFGVPSMPADGEWSPECSPTAHRGRSSSFHGRGGGCGYSPGVSDAGYDPRLVASANSRGNTNSRMPASLMKDKSSKGVDELSYENLTPCEDPDGTLRSVIQRLSAANNAKRKELNWQDQYEALNDARRLVSHHPEVVGAYVHEFVLSVIPAVDQLRSSTVKNGIILVQEMFCSLGRSLDKELEEIVPILLKKAAEVSNAGRDNFLGAEADKALSYMIQNVSEVRGISSLLTCANHKSPHLRAKVAAYLDDSLEAASGKLNMTSYGNLIEKVFKAAASFLEEGSLDTRTHGKRIIWDIKHCLSSRSSFNRLLEQLGSESKQKKVLEVVESTNGPPPPPAKTSTRFQGSRQPMGQGSLSPLTPSITPPSRTSAGSMGVEHYSREYSSGSEHRQHRLSRKCASEGSDTSQVSCGRQLGRGASQEVVDVEAASQLQDALNSISSKDWRERLEGLKCIEALTPRLGYVPDALLVTLMDQVTHRLSDGNSKVIVSGLETLRSLFSGLGDRLGFGLNTLVPALASNLGSTNDKIRIGSSQVFDQLMNAVDHVLLIQNFSHCVGHGNLRGKAVLLDKLQDIVVSVYPRKPQLVIKHTLPVTFAMLNERGADVRAANMQMIETLGRLMGPSLFQYAGNLSQANRERLQEIITGSGRGF